MIASVPIRSQANSNAAAKVEALTRKAMEEYDALEFEAAKKILIKALTLAKSEGLAAGSALEQAYLNLGIVLGAGIKDRKAAVKSLQIALSLNRKLELDPARATPDLGRLFGEALALVPQAVEPALPAFAHQPRDEAKEGHPISIVVQTSEQSGISRVVLYFRRAGESFQMMILRPDPSRAFRGVIPAEVVTGKALHYYLVATDRGGRRIDGTGSIERPIVVAIEPGTGIGGKKQPEPEKDPLIAVGVLLGFGVGIVAGGASEHTHAWSGKVEHFSVDIKPGVAIAPFHLVGELAFNVNRYWQVGALARIQVVNALSESAGIQDRVSVLGLARAKRFFGAGMSRFFVSFGAGGGQIRYRIPLGNYDNSASTPDDLVDARVAGAGAITVGGGLVVMFSRYVGFALEGNLLGLFPQFSMNLDLNSGLVFTF
jgi:hypothetical protein